MRIVDIAEPFLLNKVAYYIPEPIAGNVSPMSNDVDTDDRGFIDLLDRFVGFDILEFNRK